MIRPDDAGAEGMHRQLEMLDRLYESKPHATGLGDVRRRVLAGDSPRADAADLRRRSRPSHRAPSPLARAGARPGASTPDHSVPAGVTAFLAALLVVGGGVLTVRALTARMRGGAVVRRPLLRQLTTTSIHMARRSAAPPARGASRRQPAGRAPEGCRRGRARPHQTRRGGRWRSSRPPRPARGRGGPPALSRAGQSRYRRRAAARPAAHARPCPARGCDHAASLPPVLRARSGHRRRVDGHRPGRHLGAAGRRRACLTGSGVNELRPADLLDPAAQAASGSRCFGPGPGASFVAGGERYIDEYINYGHEDDPRPVSGRYAFRPFPAAGISTSFRAVFAVDEGSARSQYGPAARFTVKYAGAGSLSGPAVPRGPR